MKKEVVFVKVSGDLFTSPDFISRLKVIEKNAQHLVICVGGGTQINKALQQAGFKIKKHGPLGRALVTNEERQIAKDVLNMNAAKLRDLISAFALSIEVIIPIFCIGSILCHVNGDEFVKTVYHGFDRIYIFTTKDRVTKKAREFNHLQKVKIIGL